MKNKCERETRVEILTFLFLKCVYIIIICFFCHVEHSFMIVCWMNASYNSLCNLNMKEKRTTTAKAETHFELYTETFSRGVKIIFIFFLVDCTVIFNTSSPHYHPTDPPSFKNYCEFNSSKICIFYYSASLLLNYNFSSFMKNFHHSSRQNCSRNDN